MNEMIQLFLTNISAKLDRLSEDGKDYAISLSKLKIKIENLDSLNDDMKAQFAKILDRFEEQEKVVYELAGEMKKLNFQAELDLDKGKVQVNVNQSNDQKTFGDVNAEKDVHIETGDKSEGDINK